MKQEKVQIKTEKDELHPLAHYVDDRVELVKQIFSCLKTKTIRNLAPGFLKVSAQWSVCSPSSWTKSFFSILG